MSLKDKVKELGEAISKEMMGNIEATIWDRLMEIKKTYDDLLAQIEEYEFNKKK